MDRIKIKDYLEQNTATAVEVAREFNSWDGSFPEFDCFYMSDMVDCMCADHKSTMAFLEDVIFAAKSGEFNNFSDDDFVRYNDLGQLEIRSQWELEEEVIDYLNEITEELMDRYDEIYIYDDDLKELLEADDDNEEEDEE